MLIMADTASCVELAIPVALMQRVANGKTFSCFDSLGRVVDMNGAKELLELRQWLAVAKAELLEPLARHQRTTAEKFLASAVEAAVTPIDGLPAVRGVRAIAWWLHDMIDAGHIELWHGSAADLAITKLLDWCGATMDIMNPGEADRLDAAAQKSARRIAVALVAKGYFITGSNTEAAQCLA